MIIERRRGRLGETFSCSPPGIRSVGIECSTRHMRRNFARAEVMCGRSVRACVHRVIFTMIELGVDEAADIAASRIAQG